jgi:hypothetical protein
LLLADQPARTTPYTPRAVIAKMYRRPTSMLAIWIWVARPCSHSGSHPQDGILNGGP